MQLRSALKRGLPLFLIASLTLGLAPFTPEPHLWEKIRWIADGSFPMESVYFVDLLLHGSPWVLLLTSLLFRGVDRNKEKS